MILRLIPINQDKISYLKLADGTECTKRVGGTLTNARIDENYPLYAETTDYWKFILLESYTCDDEKRPGRLYGEIFYQDDNWWTYVEINSDEIDIDSEWDVGDLNVWKFATRTAIADDTFSGNYACKADADYIEQAYSRVMEIVKAGEHSVVICDEINVALKLKMLSDSQVLALIAAKPAHVELVLTGRGVSDAVVSAADLVTEMTLKKHYFDKGVNARRGIEY